MLCTRTVTRCYKISLSSGFCFPDLICPPIWQVQSPSFILIQSGNLADSHCRCTFSHYTQTPAKQEAVPPFECTNKRRRRVAKEGEVSAEGCSSVFITQLSAALCSLLILFRGSLHLWVPLRV